MYDNVLRWWFLCALDVNCIAPPTHNIGCQFAKDRFKVYANCHRYDMSSLDILLTNYFNGSFYAYANISAQQKVLSIARGSQYRERFFVCASNGSIYRSKSNVYYA